MVAGGEYLHRTSSHSALNLLSVNFYILLGGGSDTLYFYYQGKNLR